MITWPTVSWGWYDDVTILCTPNLVQRSWLTELMNSRPWSEGSLSGGPQLQHSSTVENK